MRWILNCDASFWSRLADPALSEKRRLTEGFLRGARLGHQIVVTRVVIAELSRIREPEKRRILIDRVLASAGEVVDLGSRAQDMAVELLKAGRWGANRIADMLHVAYTVLTGADALVTWDVGDLARDRTRLVVHAYARRKGLGAPLIGNPEEVAKWLDIRTRI